MVKYLLCLILLLASKASFACYCTTPWTTNQQGQSFCVANASCWACAPGAYNAAWQQLFCAGYRPPAPTCTYSAVTEQRACPVNFSGTQTWKRENNCIGGSSVDSGWFKIADTCTPLPPTCTARTETQQATCPVNQNGAIVSTRSSTCPDPYGQPVWSSWTTSNTCTPNPPTCQVTTQTRSLSCPSGFTGSITEMSTSSCPDPYGQPVQGNWVVSSNMCVKSVTNPTNVLSPVSPVSPVQVTIVPTMPLVTPPPPPMMANPMTMQMVPSMEVPAPPPAAQSQSSKESPSPSPTNSGTSPAPSTASPAASTPARSSVQRAVALTQRLELVGALPRQPSIIELISIKQELPDGIRRQQNLLIDLITTDDSWIDPNRSACDRRFSLCGDHIFQ